jgi:hypothetical protein
MSLTKTHYCDILLNMSQITAHFQNPQIATGIRYTPTTTPETLRAFIEKCGTVRGQIKSPLMKKGFSPMATDITPPPPQATGNYTHNTLNRVNNPIAYIPSFFSITFQSDSFSSHYFRIQRRKNPSVVYTFVECEDF